MHLTELDCLKHFIIQICWHAWVKKREKNEYLTCTKSGNKYCLVLMFVCLSNTTTLVWDLKEKEDIKMQQEHFGLF